MARLDAAAKNTLTCGQYVLHSSGSFFLDSGTLVLNLSSSWQPTFSGNELLRPCMASGRSKLELEIFSKNGRFAIRSLEAQVEVERSSLCVDRRLNVSLSLYLWRQIGTGPQVQPKT